ncbi:PLP-dependent aminotransferase family protein [Planomonospora venezuelensis]|uniref:GntR family transcriptional regulator/MocR family aminotransferase n=1 Tax=Planomonospora venezuelensis TaxID=1999 RepID=A0A841DHR2_PLAVE|nr:PLP-dependent aminotransferase family protein [Planomonospora venezuelensis]MBB5967848.1 GntR family transcriptional regulator/MocR family aminotransferase [Planomonospora venezuelensis]GIN03248.1 GntR family transcriptional regulator [Planomonospora venezuelensis]
MPSNRTNRITGLLLDVPGDGRALHERLTAAIRTAILAGRLGPGDALPPSRALAEELSCSRWVVNEAYTQLVAEGHLTARQGSGTRVAPDVPARPAVPPERTSTRAPSPVAADLRPGAPDVAGFPAAAWSRAMHHVLATGGGADVFPPAGGVRRLREVISGYLGRTRGVAVAPEEVVVTCGTTHAVGLLAGVLARRSASRLAVEDPGWGRLGDAAAHAGMAVEPVAVDGEGLDVGKLGRTGADAVLCSPAHQFPTGAALSAERRRALLAWAAERSAVVLEDDYDAEFRYDRKPIGALAALDRDNVAYLGSASKTLHPGLRMGWMVPPAHLRDPVIRALERSGAGPGVFDQLALARLIGTGDYDRHLRRARTLYRERREAVLAALYGHAVIRDAGPVEGIAAGLHLVLSLPPGHDDRDVADRLERRGVAVMPLSRYTRRRLRPALVIGYGRLSPSRASFAAAEIAAVLEGRPRR